MVDVAEVAQVVVEQGVDVLGPLAQRRHDDAHHAQAVVQIFPEYALAHRLLQVAMGRGDDALVHALGLAAAHPLEGVFLQETQQLDLGGGG